MLSQAHARDVCLAHNGGYKMCRYFSIDRRTGTIQCKKKSSEKKEIDEKIQDYFNDCKAKGVDPKAKNAPLGDNCSGFLVLYHIEEGYNV